MSNDFLLDISQNPTARKVLGGIGVPVPVALRRDNGPMQERPLDDLPVLVAAAPGGELATAIAQTLAEAGANPLVDSSVQIDAFQGPGEAYGRIPTAVTADDAKGTRVHGIVFDATGISTTKELEALHTVFQPWLRSIAKNGRVVVIGRPSANLRSAERAAAQEALSGFARSLSKEVSGNGSTCNAIFIQSGAEKQLPGPLRFMLDARSVYMTGQPITVLKKVTNTDEPRWSRALEGKVALVTGAARGIGKEAAKLLAQEGAEVVVLDIPPAEELATATAREIGGHVLLEDITDYDAPQTIANYLNEKFGGVDILIHNAGVTRDKTLKNMSDKYWDQAVDINLGAVIRINQHLIDSETLRENGRIVCLSSVAGIAGNRGQTNYSAAKAGLIAYVDQLGSQLASRGTTVNAIAPGFIETRLTAEMPLANREVARRMNSLGQGGQPADVAQGILFLSTPGAAGVTGNTIRICGGMLIGR